MAQPVGALRADISASTAKFEQGMKKAKKIAKQNSSAMQRSFSKLRGGVGKLAKSLLSLKGGIIALAGPAALGLLIKRSLAAADTLAKTADKVGVTTDELQELRHGAKLAGVEVKALDMGVQRFSRRVAEAAQGQGELRSTLKQYGIEVRNADGTTRSITDVMGDYAEAIKNAESDQERLRIAFKGFDSEGAALVNMLREGRAGMENFRQEAHDLGIVIDEDLLRGAEAANDAMTRLGSAIKSQVTAAVLTLAPQIENLVNKLLEGLPKLMDWIESFTRFVGLTKEAAPEVDNLNQRLELARAGFDALTMSIINAGVATEENTLKLAELAAQISELETQARLAERVTGDVAAALDHEGASVGGVFRAWKMVIPAKRKAVTATEDYIALASIEVASFKNLVRSIKRAVVQYYALALAKKAAGAVTGAGAVGPTAGIVGGFVKSLGGLFGFQHGGRFTVGGAGGPDSQLVQFMATPGEPVAVGAAAAGEARIVQEIHFHSALTDERVVREIVVPAIEEGSRRLENKLALRG